MRNLLVIGVITVFLVVMSQNAEAGLFAENHAASACQLESPVNIASPLRYSYYNGILRNEDTRDFWVVCPVVRDPTKHIVQIEVNFAHTTGSRTCWMNAVDFSGGSHYTSATGTSLVILAEPSSGVFDNAICLLHGGEYLLGYSKTYSN